MRVSARASQRGVTRSLRLLAHYIAMGKTRIRYLAAVFLLLGIIIGGALVLLLRSLIHQPSPEIAKVTQAIQELEAAQRKATDQFQAIQQMLDAEKAQVKQLSGQIDVLNDKIEPPREAGQQANTPSGSPPTRRRGTK